MTDAELVAHVDVWNSAPTGMPEMHELYARDANGWTYLTAAGRRIRDEDPAVAALRREQNLRLKDWARKAARVVLDLVKEPELRG